jgi:hypothetical protein
MRLGPSTGVAEMSKDQTPILFDVPATLHKWPSLDARRRATGETIYAQPVHHGTLGGCIREFLAKPISQRPLYEIFTSRQPGLRDSILGAQSILEIAEREDFPRE